jgi:hypothetical protein
MTVDASWCPERSGNRARKVTRRTAIPARYLLACADGHLDEDRGITNTRVEATHCPGDDHKDR